ncbi:uncharacterized protein IUM83_09832 [Phytophthora cinnamomi]|uniref:uncharacterized protein n=1 Tax=Phytophthora cinnamomi TaxID=4785 RepID=UPI00355ABD31|nr:hypothetical protein IUM83_09832 [Phytophthora cinnamomi]
MKRSRACDDLVALAADASATNSGCVSSSALRRGVDAWGSSFVEGPAHRFKRSRAAVDSPVSSGDEADDQELQERHSLQFMLEMNDLECLSAEVTLSSSAPTRSCVLDDDSLPLRRNSRENMLLRKKKQRIAEITSSFSDFGIHDEDMVHHPTPLMAKPRPMVLMETPETPEPRILRGLCFPRESRCIDPLDKRQAQPFDMSAFIMLSISPKRLKGAGSRLQIASRPASPQFGRHCFSLRTERDRAGQHNGISAGIASAATIAVHHGGLAGVDEASA